MFWASLIKHLLVDDKIGLGQVVSLETDTSIKKGPREMSIWLGTYVRPTFNRNATVPCYVNWTYVQPAFILNATVLCYVSWVLNLGRKQCQCITNFLKSYEGWHTATTINCSHRKISLSHTTRMSLWHYLLLLLSDGRKFQNVFKLG